MEGMEVGIIISLKTYYESQTLMQRRKEEQIPEEVSDVNGQHEKHWQHSPGIWEDSLVRLNGFVGLFD